MKFYIFGGINAKYAIISSFFNPNLIPIERASIDLVDFEEKTIESMLRYRVPDEILPKKIIDQRFTSASIKGDIIYVPCPTQLLKINKNNFHIENTIDCHLFNDVHHILPNEENIIVVNTGLDSIMHLSEDGSLISTESVIGENIWTRFNKETDYRRIASTKPHESHPNFAFFFKGLLWITRFIQKDAICLETKETLSIEVGNPHDGIVNEHGVYFTTTNGKIVFFNKEFNRTVFDLNKICQTTVPLGWCRGIHIEQNIAYVCFSALRPTGIENNISWVKNMGRSSKRLPSRIVKFDLNLEVKLDEFIIPSGYTNMIFNLIPSEV